MEVWEHQMRKAVRWGRMSGRCLEDSMQDKGLHHHKGVRFYWRSSSSSFPSPDLVASFMLRDQPGSPDTPRKPKRPLYPRSADMTQDQYTVAPQKFPTTPVHRLEYTAFTGNCELDNHIKNVEFMLFYIASSYMQRILRDWQLF